MRWTLAPIALLAVLMAAPADAREPERLHLSGSHWDGSGALQLVHPTDLDRRSGYAGGWAGTASDVGWSNEPFRRTAGAGLHAGYTLIKRVRLDVALPVWPSLIRSDAAGNEFSSGGIGDLRLGATVPFLQFDSGVGLAVAPVVDLPTGDPAKATGGVTAGGVTVALGGRTAAAPTVRGLPGRGVGWRLNGGWHGGGAPEASGTSLGAGLDATVTPGVVVGAELTALLRGQNGQPTTGTPDPVDAHAYLTVGIDEHLLGTLAGGAGLTGGEGSPGWRVLMSVGWQARGDDADPDNDGVRAGADLCPTTPEGPGGDGDGCPNPDRDRDGVPDSVDACPDEPEDRDGYGDSDGCPEPDNDLDGLLDGNDLCPFDPGPLYTEGCPDFDNDGLADRIDECPDVRGPERSFGCPDMDADEVPDYRDDCPETPDHIDADPLRSDGCPGLAWPRGDRIELTDQVRFDFGRATIRPESLPTLNAVARILKRNGDIRLLEVAGHTDNVGGASANLRLSRLRAAAVRQYLVSQGVASSRLVAKGYGETLPVDTNLTDPGRFFNRRVEFLIERTSSAARD